MKKGKKRGQAPYLPKEVLDRVIGDVRGINAARNRAVLLFSHYLGLRAKEIAGLVIGDVFDPRTGIRDTLRLFKTKGDKFREAFLVNEETREALNAYLTYRGVTHTETPLFLSQKGGAFSANTMQRMIGNLYRRASVRGSSHSGRRSFATRLIESGTDIFTIKELMGHSSISTTQQYFATSPERLKRAVASLR